MFVKYNGLLRGLQSDAPFLRNTMLQLCCPKDIAAHYQGTAKMHELANRLGFEGVPTLDEAVTVGLAGQTVTPGSPLFPRVDPGWTADVE